jgi:hypothetical protein
MIQENIRKLIHFDRTLRDRGIAFDRENHFEVEIFAVISGEFFFVLTADSQFLVSFVERRDSWRNSMNGIRLRKEKEAILFLS